MAERRCPAKARGKAMPCFFESKVRHQKICAPLPCEGGGFVLLRKLGCHPPRGLATQGSRRTWTNRTFSGEPHHLGRHLRRRVTRHTRRAAPVGSRECCPTPALAGHPARYPQSGNGLVPSSAALGHQQEGRSSRYRHRRRACGTGPIGRPRRWLQPTPALRNCTPKPGGTRGVVGWPT